MANSINEIIEADNYLYRDLIKCCNFFISDQCFFKEKNYIGNDIWDTPIIADVLVKNHANRNIIKNIFETICIFEKSIPSSGIGFIYNFLGAVKTDQKHIRGRSTFVFNQVEKFVRCQTTKKIINLVKKYGNPGVSLTVTREPIDKPIIKFSSMPNIKIKIAEGFLAKKTNFCNCHFLMIDGAISSTSELTSILNKSFEEKNSTYFLVCKSFTSEVIYTLQENYTRGLTNVIPLQFGFDLESINALPDLVSVIGGLPLSAALGDLISAANFDRMGKCDECKIDGNKIILKSNIDNSIHRKRLILKIENSTSVEKKELLSKRLSGLTSNSCKVILPMSKLYNQVERNIKYSAILLKEMIQKPVVEYKFKKQKFYISKDAFKIQIELENKIQDLLKTKIFLPRRNNE